MLLHLDAGHTDDLRAKLDTPNPDDDVQGEVVVATDTWLTTVAELVQIARELVEQVAQIAAKSY